jgi:hypothetical protein
VIDITIANGIATVKSTVYKPRIIEAIRTIRGRKWNAAKKTWTIPATPIRTFQQSVERLVRTGELVQVNGREWTGTAETQQLMADRAAAELEAAEAANPFVAVWKMLPPGLRQPAFDALWKVLSPVAGGDVGLLTLLDQAHNSLEGDGGRRLIRVQS